MTNTPNPYQAPNLTSALPVASRDASSRRKIAVWLAVYLSPLLAMSTFYLCWLVAWATLGHLPRPMLDDPKSIGGVVDVVYAMTMIATLFMPAFLILGLVSCWMHPTKPTEARIKKGFTLASFYFLGCVALWVLARTDPGRVLEWWFD